MPCVKLGSMSVFVWLCTALKSPKRRFLACAVDYEVLEEVGPSTRFIYYSCAPRLGCAMVRSHRLWVFTDWKSHFKEGS
jgi:hypothetical protein